MGDYVWHPDGHAAFLLDYVKGVSVLDFLSGSEKRVCMFRQQAGHTAAVWRYPPMERSSQWYCVRMARSSYRS